MSRFFDVLFGTVRTNQVDDTEDDDPYDVNEVPVQACDLDLEGIALVDLAIEGREEQRPEPEDPDGHVGAVEACHDQEGTTKKVRARREAFVGEFGELVHLETDENTAQEGGGDKPESGFAHLASL